MSEDAFHFVVPEGMAGYRFDQCLVSLLPDLTRSRLQSLIKDEKILLNGKAVSPSHKVKAQDRIDGHFPPPEEPIPQGQNIPLTIVYEDDDLVVIDKPPGLVVHPGAGNPDGTLVNALIQHCGASLSGIGGVRRPGIVHRLDKGTSGLLVAAKNDMAHQGLAHQFSDRSLSRTYIAFCWGLVTPPSGMLSQNIGRDPHHRQRMKALTTGGKPALTLYKVLQSYQTIASLVECTLKTGRTHQIRVHLSQLGYPLLGDELYKKLLRTIPQPVKSQVQDILGPERVALHAQALRFIHPRTREEMAFTCDMPADLRALAVFLTAAS